MGELIIGVVVFFAYSVGIPRLVCDSWEEVRELYRSKPLAFMSILLSIAGGIQMGVIFNALMR